MVNDTEGKDSSTRTVDSLAARGADKPEPRRTGDDDPDRIGGDLQTRSGSQPADHTKPGEDDKQQTGGSNPPNDDPERGA
jgi:hypothetical protein